MPGGVNARTVEEFRNGPGRLSDALMWMLAYQRVVNPFLLRGRAAQSRIHGQYEAKARIIGRLLREADTRIQAPPNDRIELLRELAVSWMQSGRLHSAREACDQAEREIAKLAGWSGDTAAVSPKEPPLWRHFCDIRSLRMAIDLRYGRPVDVVVDGLGPVVEKALEIAAAALKGSEPVKEGQTPYAEAGAIRILARAAEVALNAGDVERAIDLFETANALTAAIRGRALEGDAAREFAIALVRARNGSTDRLRRAEALIDANVANLEARRGGGGPSIDLIRFLILKASMRRIAGDLEGAEAMLATAETHDYVTSGKCTYITHSKLGLERLRLEIASGRADRALDDRAASLAARVYETNHLRLHHEMLLVQAEIAEREERKALLDDARAFMRGRGWMLRRADADLIDRGGSAVLEFGL
jgi:tetratricopeptide (TPR) repeat protein